MSTERSTSSTGRSSRRTPPEVSPAAQNNPMSQQTANQLLTTLQSLSQAIEQLREGPTGNEQVGQIIRALDQINQQPTQTTATTSVPSRTPGLALLEKPIDHTTSAGIKIYNAMTAPLPSKFDHTTDNIVQITSDLERRSENSGLEEGNSQIMFITNK